MKKAYLGLDIGTISAKGVVIDKNNVIITSAYLLIKDNPIKTTTKLLKVLKKNLKNEYQIVGVGITGLYRNLIKKIIPYSVVKNEIIAHTTGTLTIYPKVKTIIEIGGGDSKIIILNSNKIIDYEINNISSVEIGKTLDKNNNINTDIIVQKYLTSLGKNRKLLSPIVFQGGVAKNNEVLNSFEKILDKKIYVDRNAHLMGALGVAIISSQNKEITFDFTTKKITNNSMLKPIP